MYSPSDIASEAPVGAESPVSNISTAVKTLDPHPADEAVVNPDPRDAIPGLTLGDPKPVVEAHLATAPWPVAKQVNKNKLKNVKIILM